VFFLASGTEKCSHGQRKMNSSSKNPPQKPTSLRGLGSRALNLLLWLVFCSLAGTGLLLAFRLPPGSRGGKGLSAMGLDRHDWGDVHTWIGYTFIILILLHLVLHWRWLWQFASKRRPAPMLAGLGAGLALLLALVFVPVERNEGSEKGSKGKGRQQSAHTANE